MSRSADAHFAAGDWRNGDDDTWADVHAECEAADAALESQLRELLAVLRDLLGAFDATCEAGRSGVSPAQAIVQREAARHALAALEALGRTP